MGLKLFGVGGIDQKSNNLLRDPMDLVDARNVMASIDNEYIKRPGTDEDTQFTDDDYNDMIFIKSLNQYFHRFNNEYVTYENGTRRLVPKYFEPTGDPTSNLSSAEYLNTLIFTHENLTNGTAKYDGGSIYRAGLPTPYFTMAQSGAAKVGFVSGFYEFIDGKGNCLRGPLRILPRTNENLTITVQTISNSLSKSFGFYNGFIKVANLYVKTLKGNGSLSDRTLDYDSISDSISVGLKIPIRTSQGGINGTIDLRDALTAPPSVFTLTSDQFILLEIESIDTALKKIVFTASSFDKKEVDIVGGTDMNISCNWTLRLFESTSETTGYTQAFDDNYVINQANSTQNIIDPFFLGKDILMSDIYDITTSKLRPPKCKYLYTYGYQLVCAPAISFYNFENEETLYTNNDLVMYSDVSTGDLGENFSEGNRQLIGNTYDGFLTGLARVKDSIIATKNRSIWALDGILIPGQYALRKIETNQIGCLSAKSLLEIDSAIMFQGQDGIYATDGYKAEKVSEKLDPLFRTINPLLTRSVMNNVFDQYLFWTDQAIVVFDYHYKKIYLWDSIDASKGITVDNDLSIRFFSALKSTKFQTDLNDSGVAIDAYIRSAWHDLGEPGLLKKATFLRLYAFKNTLQKISLKYFLDWDETKFKGPFEFDMDSVTVKRNLDVIQNQSFSFEFRNNEIDQNLNISGYEVNTAVIQERDKNVK